MIFEDCRVPEENVIGAVGDGFKIAMKTLDIGRLTLAASCIGYAQKLLKMGSEYAKVRVQFGKPIAEFQAIQWMLADSATEIYAANSMMMDAALRYDAGERSPAWPAWPSSMRAKSPARWLTASCISTGAWAI